MRHSSHWNVAIITAPTRNSPDCLSILPHLGQAQTLFDEPAIISTLVGDRQLANQSSFWALSVRQPWASLIAAGLKSAEIRSRPIKYRGELLICASARPVYDDLPTGVALCLVDLVDCRPMIPTDETIAGVKHLPDHFSWILANPRPITQFAVKGQLGLFTVNLPAHPGSGPQ